MRFGVKMFMLRTRLVSPPVPSSSAWLSSAAANPGAFPPEVGGGCRRGTPNRKSDGALAIARRRGEHAAGLTRSDHAAIRRDARRPDRGMHPGLDTYDRRSGGGFSPAMQNWRLSSTVTATAMPCELRV
jgi:hypothetical protein